MQYYINPPPMSPLSRVLAAVMAVVALVAAFFFGLIILALAFGTGLMLWLGMRLRLWWLRRHGPLNDMAPPGTPQRHETIDAEYTVVSTDED